MADYRPISAQDLVSPAASPLPQAQAGPAPTPNHRGPSGYNRISADHLVPLPEATEFAGSGSGSPVQAAMGAQNAPISPIDDPTKLPKIESTAVASLPKDPMMKARYLASSIFPDLAPDEALKRFGFDGSRFYYVANDGKPYFAEPNFSPKAAPAQTLAETPDLIASKVGPVLPYIGGIGGGVLGGPDPASVATAAAGGALGESIRQAGAQWLAGEQLPLVESVTHVGEEAGLQALNQAVGLGVGKVAEKVINANPMKASAYDVKTMTPLRLSEIDANTQLANSHNIQVTPGEAGNVRSLLARQRQLGRLDESATPMGDFYAKRNTQQIPDAWSNFLTNEVSPIGAPAVGNRNLGAAADEVIEAAKEARRAVSQPEYQAVMRAQNVISPHDFNGLMTSGEYGPLYANALNEVRKDKLLSPLIEGMPDASLPVLDLVKRYLDGLAGAADRAGDATRAGVAGKAAANLRDSLDPLFPGYAKARAAFEGASPEVDALKNGIVGLAAKERASGLQGVSRTLFNAQSSDPVSVAQAKTAFIKAGKMDEWNDGLRAFLQNTYDDAAKQAQGPAPALHRSLVGDQRQADVLRAAMTPNQWVAFNDLMRVVEMVKRAPAEGSPTATDMGAREAFAGPAANAAAKVAKGANPLNWPQMLHDTIIDWSAGRNIGRMVDVITDPNAVQILRRVQTLTPGTKQWIDEIGYLGSVIGQNEIAAQPKLPPPTPIGQLPAPGNGFSDGGVVTTKPTLKEFLADKRPLREILAETRAKRAAQGFADGGVVQPKGGRPQAMQAFSAVDPTLAPTVTAVFDKNQALANHRGDFAVVTGKPMGPGTGQLESYPPEELYNPIPGRATTEVYNQDPAVLQNLVTGDFLHRLGAVDQQTGQPVDRGWRVLKASLLNTMTPEQDAENRRAYDWNKAKSKGKDTRSFRQFMDQSRGDEFIMGSLTPDKGDYWRGRPGTHQPSMYTPQQDEILNQMRGYLVKGYAKGGVVTKVNSPAEPAATPPTGTGHRHNPVRPEAAEHVEAAGKIIGSNDVGRPQLGHMTWNGLQITLEVPKGGTRTAKDGSWSVPNMPACYGYLKRTTGADNEQVDVYFGDHPQSARVFVIDQVDPKTRRFDEHKACLGFATPAAARQAYLGAFSDKSGASRIGAMTQMSVDQFKNWLKRGKRTKAVGKLPPPRSGASRDARSLSSAPLRSSAGTAGLAAHAGSAGSTGHVAGNRT